MNRGELQQLAAERAADAAALLAAQRWAGAYYLAGYAVECGLKACIARQTQAFDFPDKRFADKVFTHNLAALVTHANLQTAVDQRGRQDRQFWDNWLRVVAWSEESRYLLRSESDARELVTAVTDGRYGVLPWIQTYW